MKRFRRWWRVTFKSYRILSVDHARDTMLIYRWNDVVATEVTMFGGARFFFPTDRVMMMMRISGVTH
jgi:hypothetical protein